MRKNQANGETGILTESEPKRRPGRKPMTAEEKAAAAKARAEEKEKANNLKPALFLQYQDCDLDMQTLVDAAKADFRKAKKRTLVTELKLYIKPEDRMAYYVVNGEFEGSIPF